MENTNIVRMQQEDEIDLKELFKVLSKRKIFIFTFAIIITIFAAAYSFIAKPTYEVKAVIEVGSYTNTNTNTNTNTIENPQNLMKKIEISHIDNLQKESLASLQTVALVKNTTNLIELVVHSSSNEKALAEMTKITEEIINDHKVKTDNYIATVQTKLDNLLAQKKQYETNGAKEVKVSVENFPSFSRYGTTMLDMTNQIEDLKLSISKNNLINTHVVGKITSNQDPIKPKKSLIVVVSFVTSLILAIFLVFFLEFLKGNKNDE